MITNSKAAKEEFVSNLEGTSPLELLLISSTVPLGLYVFLSLVPSHCRGSRGGSGTIVWVEFLAFWFPAILCQSVWSFPWVVVYFIGLVLYSYYVSGTNSIGGIEAVSTTTNSTTFSDRVQLGITIYRAGLLCLTCVAILAVDFSFFPRRLAKTEVHGYGWMDLGAASFCIAAGIVSPLARGNNNNHPAVGVVMPKTKFKRIIPVVLMGLLRLVTHKGIDYQEHASEYGVHWNFFFTLAVLNLLSIIVPTTYRPTILIPGIIMAIYQGLALQHYGLQEWIETAPRFCGGKVGGVLCDLFVANREGFFGCLGYGSLFFASEWIASVAIWSNRVNIWMVVSVLILFWLTLDTIGNISISRRSTNLTFCLWALVVNFLQLASIQTVINIKKTALVVPPLLDAMNRNGLLTFVIANLLTGLVNLTVDTLNTSNAIALLVLCLYMAAVSGIAVMLEHVKTFQGSGKKHV